MLAPEGTTRQWQRPCWFDGDLRHAAYIGHWIELLKADKRISPPAAVLQRLQITCAVWRLPRPLRYPARP